MTDAVTADVTMTGAATADVTTTDAATADMAMTDAATADVRADAVRADVTKADAAENRDIHRKEPRVQNAPRAFAAAGDCTTIRSPWSIRPAKVGMRSMLPTLRFRAEQCFQSLICRLNLQNAERGACDELS